MRVLIENDIRRCGLHSETAAALVASKIYTTWDLRLATKAAVKSLDFICDRDWSRIEEFMQKRGWSFGQSLSDPNTAVNYIVDKAEQDPRLEEALHTMINNYDSSVNEIELKDILDAMEGSESS